MYSIFNSRKANLQIEVAISLLVIVGIVIAIVYLQSFGKETMETLEEEGYFPNNTITDTVMAQQESGPVFFDWTIVVVIVILAGGSLYFIGQYEDTRVITVIMVFIMIIVAFVAAHLSNTWSDIVDDRPTLEDDYPKTNWFFNNYVAVVVVIMLLQIFFGIIKNGTGGGGF